MNNAFLVINKPAGITSHDVVGAVRAITGIKKVGHTGTLDPFATGVLPLALGSATKLIRFLDERLKVYDATIALGSATDTGDLTGTVIDEVEVPAFSDEQLKAVLDGFLGEQDQIPPQYSAIKKDGKALYTYARKGEFVEVPARKITISQLDVLEQGPSSLRVLIHCSRGTYARVLADDIAKALGTRGHLSALERRQSGPFLLENAVSFDEVAAFAAKDESLPWQTVLFSRERPRTPWKPRAEVVASLLPWQIERLDVLRHLPSLDVSPEIAKRVRNGAVPPVFSGVSVGEYYRITCGDQLIAVMERTEVGAKVLRVERS